MLCMAGPTPLLIHVSVCVHVCVCTCVNVCVFIQLLSSTFQSCFHLKQYFGGKKTTCSDASLVFPIVKKVFRRSAEILLLYYSLTDRISYENAAFWSNAVVSHSCTHSVLCTCNTQLSHLATHGLLQRSQSCCT